MCSDISKIIESELIHFLFPIRIKVPKVVYPLGTGFQDVIIDYRCYPRVFLVENRLFTFFKNNIYSKKNSANKYMFKINKRHTRERRELFLKLPRKQHDVTDVFWMSLLLTFNTFYYLR